MVQTGVSFWEHFKSSTQLHRESMDLTNQYKTSSMKKVFFIASIAIATLACTYGTFSAAPLTAVKSDVSGIKNKSLLAGNWITISITTTRKGGPKGKFADFS
jgi:hypothetical protein